jgi:hypothetical protein
MLSAPRPLLELSAEEQERVRSLLRRTNGKLAVLVHPFFHEGMGTPHWVVPHLEGYLPRLEKLARSPKLPLAVVFEEHDRVGETHERLQELAPGRFLLYVPTGPGTSHPHLSTWASVAQSLMDLGARRLYLGGEYHSSKAGVAQYFACVTNAEDRLRTHGRFESVRVLPKTVIELR